MRETPTHPGRPKHDAAYKSLFARRRTVEDTLRAIHVATATGEAAKRDSELEDLARHLDFSTFERMPASFVTEHLGRRQADMLWKIRTVDETWLHLLILFEFQSTSGNGSRRCWSCGTVPGAGDWNSESGIRMLADISDSDRLAAIAAGVFTCETVVELVRLARGDATALERA